MESQSEFQSNVSPEAKIGPISNTSRCEYEESDTIKAPPETVSPDASKRYNTSRKDKILLVLTFISLQLTLFLSALDATIITTALPTIGSEFKEMSNASWVLTAYVLTFNAFQPLFSKFSDIFGRKAVILFGVSLFLFGSLVCGLANSMPMLIAGRVVAGIGSAGGFSMVFVIIADIVPLEKRGSFQGVINSVFALASITGPLVGGMFTDYVTWRWNFYMNLPIGAVAGIILVFFLHLPVPKGNLRAKLGRIDYIGTTLVLAFATLFLLAMNFGGQLFPWNSAPVIVSLILSVVLVGVLAIVELHFAKEPIIPPRLFKIRSVVSILLTNWFFGIAFYGSVSYLPQFFQIVYNDTAMWSGIRLIPLQLSVCTFSAISGCLISRVDKYRIFITLGMALMTISMGLYSLFDRNSGWAVIYGLTVLGGAGIGCLFAPTVVGLQSSVARRDIAVVIGLGNFSRILGGALGIAIAASIQNTVLHRDLPKVLPAEYVTKVIDSAEFVQRGLPPQYLDATLDVYTTSFRLLWYFLIPIAGLGFISSLFIQHKSTRQSDVEKSETMMRDPISDLSSKPISVEIDHQEHKSEKP